MGSDSFSTSFESVPLIAAAKTAAKEIKRIWSCAGLASSLRLKHPAWDSVGSTPRF